MAVTFDPETQALMEKYHQEKRKRSRRAFHEGMIGATQAMRGEGLKGADYVNARKGYIEGGIDGEAMWMNPEEKLEHKERLDKELFAREQFFYGLAFEESMTEYKEMQDNYRTLLGVIEQSRATNAASARQAASLKVATHSRNVDRLMADIESMWELSPAAKVEVDAALQNQTMSLEASPEYAALEEQLVAEGMSPTAARKAILDDPDIMREHTRKIVNNIINDEEMDPAQKMAAMEYVGKESGISPEEFLAPWEAEWEAITNEAYANLDARKGELAMEADLTAKWASKTYGGVDPNLVKALEANAEAARESRAVPMEVRAARHAEAAKTRKGVGEEDMLGPVEYDEPEGDFDPSAQEEFLGLPMKPAATAQERTLQLLQTVEDYPEHPPARQAKMDLMASPGFQSYKSSRGYEGLNDDDVLKEWHREYKHMVRSNKREFRARRRQNIEAGVAPPKVGSAMSTSPTSGRPAPQKAPVAGSD
jgi:hypothetical protein